MDIQRELFWQPGLLLQPQHLQLQAQALHSPLIPLYKYAGAHFWGVGSLDIDQGSISTGIFRLRCGRVLFPDGTYVELPGNALVAAATFDPGLVEGKPLNVYLGLKRWNESGPNVTVVDGPDHLHGVTTRYVSLAEPERVRDLHGGGAECPVKRLHYLLRICWEGELDRLGDYLLVPVARLEPCGAVRLSDRYIPPALALDAVDPLLRLATEIRDLVAARSHQLGRYKRDRGVPNADSGSRDMVYLLTLRTLNRHLPQLSHLIEAGAVHPWRFYGALRQLVGELSCFSDTVDVRGETTGGSRMLPPYDHRMIWDCFSAAHHLVALLLDEITAGPEYRVSLSHDGCYYCADLKPALLEGRHFYLALCTELDPQLVLQALESVAKLSAREHLSVLCSRALPGIGLEFVQAPPQELPRQPHTLYFSVNHHDEQWEIVTREKSLALQWDQAPADLAVELMVVERAQKPHA